MYVRKARKHMEPGRLLCGPVTGALHSSKFPGGLRAVWGCFAAHAIDRGIAGKGMGVGVYDGEAGSGMVSLLQRDFCQRYVCAHRGGR